MRKSQGEKLQPGELPIRQGSNDDPNNCCLAFHKRSILSFLVVPNSPTIAPQMFSPSSLTWKSGVWGIINAASRMPVSPVRASPPCLGLPRKHYRVGSRTSVGDHGDWTAAASTHPTDHHHSHYQVRF
ncbi:hypothetical protein ECG_04995 [Echinococcus granulosus]|nr:hypothetical protein ECG_04995 [Echinococcus granulosus]